MRGVPDPSTLDPSRGVAVASYAPLVGFASGDLGFFSEVRSALFPAITASTARLFGFASGNLGYNSEVVRLLLRILQKFRVNWIALMAPSGRALSVKVPGTGVK
ncbi:predicted protein [Arabidopsis lyrata subsp. lyrata]|uniref:Predicted protein n=1 Tax=Arabidopsis lyrata subsp. lyrata TaxID=81972 RepID=D7L4U2_ARALL|nr:predicted protein [Arabidopsis lyrata subsp. lyrata]